MPRSASPQAYDCADDLPPQELQAAQELVEVTIDDARGNSTRAGGWCSDAGFTALILDGATDVHVTFVVSNTTYAYPAMTLDLAGPIRGDVDLGHVAIVPAPRSSP